MRMQCEQCEPLQARLREVVAERDRLARGLENCRLLAAREVRKADQSHASSRWNHILRFCKDAGIVGSVLRTGPPPSGPDEGEGRGE